VSTSAVPIHPTEICAWGIDSLTHGGGCTTNWTSFSSKMYPQNSEMIHCVINATNIILMNCSVPNRLHFPSVCTDLEWYISHLQLPSVICLFGRTDGSIHILERACHWHHCALQLCWTLVAKHWFLTNGALVQLKHTYK